MKKKSFTLIELMVVVAIIGLLGAMITPQVNGIMEKARIARARADVNSVVMAMQTLLEDTSYVPGERPAPQGDCTGTNLNGQGYGIIQTNGNYPQWAGPYLRNRIGLDPWGRDYYYDGGDAGEWDNCPGCASFASGGFNGNYECFNLADLNCVADDIIVYLKRR